MNFNDRRTKYCSKCNTKNSVIEYMIQASQDTLLIEQEQRELNSYGKIKDRNNNKEIHSSSHEKKAIEERRATHNQEYADLNKYEVITKLEFGCQYEMKGNFYSCTKCDDFSVHKDFDKLCLNQKCPTNKFNKSESPL